MKRLSLAVVLLGSAFSLGLRAQVLDARSNVPFDFWLGEKLMPAGEYSIYSLSFTGAVLLQGGAGERHSAAFLGQQLSRNDAPNKGKLEFTRYGNTYFLSE